MQWGRGRVEPALSGGWRLRRHQHLISTISITTTVRGVLRAIFRSCSRFVLAVAVGLFWLASCQMAAGASLTHPHMLSDDLWGLCSVLGFRETEPVMGPMDAGPSAPVVGAASWEPRLALGGVKATGTKKGTWQSKPGVCPASALLSTGSLSPRTTGSSQEVMWAVRLSAFPSRAWES